jgi:copper chaperone
MVKETIKISGMTCNHCIKSVEDAIKTLPVAKFKVAMNSLEVEFEEMAITESRIVETIEEEGYKVININHN